MYCPEIRLIDKQGNGVEPLQKLVPFVGVMLELFEGFADQPVVPGIVLPQERLATAGAGTGAVAQGVVLVISHYDAGGTMLDHVPDQM